MQTVYDQPSNAGPMDRTPDTDEAPLTWRDFLDVAQEECRDAQRVAADDLERQLALRLQSISQAEASLREARLMLLAQVPVWRLARA